MAFFIDLIDIDAIYIDVPYLALIDMDVTHIDVPHRNLIDINHRCSTTELNRH